jgi:hypothetical protein
MISQQMKPLVQVTKSPKYCKRSNDDDEIICPLRRQMSINKASQTHLTNNDIPEKTFWQPTKEDRIEGYVSGTRMFLTK